MDGLRSKLELEYELQLTKKILERIIELNQEQNLILPNREEIDIIEEKLQRKMQKTYPAYKISKKPIR